MRCMAVGRRERGAGVVLRYMAGSGSECTGCFLCMISEYRHKLSAASRKWPAVDTYTHMRAHTCARVARDILHGLRLAACGTCPNEPAMLTMQYGHPRIIHSSPACSASHRALDNTRRSRWRLLSTVGGILMLVVASSSPWPAT